MLRNFTLDDASPLIQYDGSWADGYNSTADSQMPRYQGRSFHCTYTDGATANITFHGTAIYLYGAKRNNHGYYRVAVNDEPSIPMSGRPEAGAPEEFQTLLFSRQGLESGEHTLRMTNVHEDSNRVWVDIDFIVITREVDASPEAQTNIATHDEFTYSSLWNTQTNMPGYRNSTAHITNTPGETATLKFQGPEVFVYGGVGPKFGAFKVQVDNREPVVLNATTGFTHPPVTLFTTSGLGDGEHTLTITNIEGGKSLTLDYAEYATGRSGSNAGLIGGVVGGVLGALVVFAVLGWYFLRKRKRTQGGGLDIDAPFPSMLSNPHQGSQIHVSPFANNPSQPPLGYVDARPITPNAHTPNVSSIRKTDMLVTPLPTLRSDESSYGPPSQHGLSSLSSPTEISSVHEIDAGTLSTLPPMYDQVFSSQPVRRGADAPSPE
ncbi:unnamed protein product [Rhizoctonia solani]|uniref:Transmembrane protein n=1 Tax=Rhizoctonia solani TaxID=456999 RepID=A0A8H3ASQ8_9AGAM|nr:unnamed protein product [Rhizoctonia solani]